MEELNWMEIGGRIKELRKNNRITIERLAEMICVSTSFIGLVEKGDSGISIDNLFRLSKVFQVSVDYLLTGEQNKEPNTAPTKFNRLETALYDYSEDEIAFLLELSKFLKSRVSVKN